MVIRILHPYIWAYQSPPAISSSSLLFHVKKCFFYFLFYFLFLSLYLEVVLEDYNNDRARVLKKVLLPLFHLLLMCMLVDKKQTLLLCFIIGHCLVLYTLHLRLPPVMHAGTLPQPYRILSERGQKNLSVGIFLVPSCGICTTK